MASLATSGRGFRRGAASYFLCFAKESMQRKATPAFAPGGWPGSLRCSVDRAPQEYFFAMRSIALGASRKTRLRLKHGEPTAPGHPALLGAREGSLAGVSAFPADEIDGTRFISGGQFGAINHPLAG